MQKGQGSQHDLDAGSAWDWSSSSRRSCPRGLVSLSRTAPSRLPPPTDTPCVKYITLGDTNSSSSCSASTTTSTTSTRLCCPGPSCCSTSNQKRRTLDSECPRVQYRCARAGLQVKGLDFTPAPRMPGGIRGYSSAEGQTGSQANENVLVEPVLYNKFYFTLKLL